MSHQSPTVRIAGIQATPLKHTSPVPLHGGNGKQVPYGGGIQGTEDDPLGLLSSSNSIGDSPLGATRPPVSPSVLAAASSAVDANLDQEQMLRAFLLLVDKVPAPFDPKTLPSDITQRDNLVNHIEKLVTESAWSTIIETTSQMIEILSRRHECFLNDGKDLSPVILGRFDALLRMKKFDVLSEEIRVVLEEEHRLVGPVRGRFSSVRLQLTLLRLEVKSLIGSGDEAIEEVVAMCDAISTLLQTGAYKSLPNIGIKEIRFWSWRLRAALVNMAIKQRSFKIAASELNRLLQEVRSYTQSIAADSDSTSADEVSAKRAEVAVLCRLARLFLHQGALKLGIQKCDEAMELLHSASLSTDRVASHVHLTRGLALYSITDYEEASKLFEELMTTHEKDEAVSASDDGFASVIFGEEPLYSCAVNSYAICALQMKNISLSIRKLELLILKNPARMVDSIVFNLCTLYDLSSNATISAKKKKVIQQVATKYGVSVVINPKSYLL